MLSFRSLKFHGKFSQLPENAHIVFNCQMGTEFSQNFPISQFSGWGRSTTATVIAYLIQSLSGKINIPAKIESDVILQANEVSAEISTNG
jgi:hypothetical protein